MQTKTMTINMGPQHPATHGVLRVILEIDGETVVRCQPEVGYLHTGIEKTAESKLYYKALPMTDRMDYLAPMSNNLGYCLGVEKFLGVEVPEKAQWVRVLLAEVTRINSHLVWLGTHALDIGALSMVLYAFREREDVLSIYEAVSGQRMMSTYFRIGGLSEDLPENFDQLVRTLLKNMPSSIAGIRKHSDQQSYLAQSDDRRWQTHCRRRNRCWSYRSIVASIRCQLRFAQSTSVFEL